MNESTIQFIMRAFSILICIVVGLGMATLCAVVVRDGSTPLVATALDDIKVIAIGGFSSIVVMVTGRSIVSNTIQSAMSQTATTTATTSQPSGMMTSTTTSAPALVQVAANASGGDGSAASGGTSTQSAST